MVERNLLDTLVADSRRDHSTPGEQRRLDRDTSAERGGPTPAEEPGERRGQRDRGQSLERATLGALAAGKGGALVALAQVCAQRAFLLARQPSVELARDRELRLVTGDPFLELLAQRAKEKGITKVAFDRSGFKFHGRVKALADAAREGGLEF